MDRLTRLLYSFVLIFSIACAFYYCTASADGTSYVADKYSQFDDRIAMVDVNGILHPGDTKHFIFYTISGSTLFYGRVMMWTDALVSYFPDMIWGVKGQVIATRLTHFLVLLLAIHLLISIFIKDDLLKAMTLLFIVVSPYFIYFSFIPKPEPFVLLFLVLFLKGFLESNWNFGWHYIWLGLAYGCKISVLPLLPVFFVLPIFYRNQKFQASFAPIEILKSIAFTIAGFLICLPCLILSPVKPVFFHTYIYQAFGSAKKEYDDASIDLLSWLHHLFNNYYSVFPGLIIFLFLLILGIAVYTLVKDKKISQGHLLLGVGLIQLFLIFLLTKRIWPHYLFVGLTLSIIAGLALFENLFVKWNKLFAFGLVLFIIPQSITFARDIITLHNREHQPEFCAVQASGQKAFNYLQSKNIHSIAFDLSTYVPNELVVLGQHNEPFPALKKQTDLRIESINEYGDALYTTNFDAIIFQKNCPCDTANRLSKEYFMKDAFESFTKYVPSAYHLDTSFSETKVFLKNKSEP